MTQKTEQPHHNFDAYNGMTYEYKGQPKPAITKNG